jgi:hypothetical protein
LIARTPAVPSLPVPESTIPIGRFILREEAFGRAIIDSVVAEIACSTGKAPSCG